MVVYWTLKCGAGNRFASLTRLSVRWQYARKIRFSCMTLHNILSAVSYSLL